MDESDTKRLSLFLDGQLGSSEQRALEKRLQREAKLRSRLEDLRHTDRVLSSPETWSAPDHELSRRLSCSAEGEEDAELGALRAALEAFEAGETPAASESLLQRVKARGTPSRSRSGRKRKSSVRIVRRSARLRMGSGSARIRRRSSRVNATPAPRPSTRRPAVGRVSAAGRVHTGTPWSAWAGLLAAACIAFIVGGLVFSRPDTESRTAQTPPVVDTPTPVVTPERPDAPPAPVTPDEPTAPESDPVLEPERDPEPDLDLDPEPQLDPPSESEPTRTFARAPIVDDGGRLRLTRPTRGALERRSDAGWEPLPADAELAPGDRLRARQPSFASFDNGAYDLCLDAGAEVVIRRAQNGPVLDLERGRVLAEVVSLQQGERFEVLTQREAYQVLGTVFEVARDGGNSSLGVLEGAVRASRGAESLVATAGHGVRAAQSLSPIDTPEAGQWAAGLRPERRVLWSADFEAGVNGFSGEAVAHPTQSGSALSLVRSREAAWGRATAIEHTVEFGRDLYLQLSVRAEEDASVLLRFTNASQDDRRFMATYAVRAGQWRTLTIPFEALSTLYDPGRNPLRAGDRLTQLEVLASAKGRVLIDDLQVYRKHYR